MPPVVPFASLFVARRNIIFLRILIPPPVSPLNIISGRKTFPFFSPSSLSLARWSIFLFVRQNLACLPPPSVHAYVSPCFAQKSSSFSKRGWETRAGLFLGRAWFPSHPQKEPSSTLVQQQHPYPLLELKYCTYNNSFFCYTHSPRFPGFESVCLKKKRER